ncbi:metal-dependent transcriptional regulator [Crassaminicella profunda]|uniref:metal-dependent transcriptional regulator n=1 Tax=Crassaminicella profunda TaxID=1286698 RepID=UPI001CA6208E|nr:metal-dependent transcriptional regulator [Crassaminicella profunda]QZY55393.1 metal-dependent transcriptional regulator [Crassaminicella profunda]
MKYNESVEMYLETIYILEKEHGHAHGVDIAEALGVSKASVSKAMGQLKSRDLVYKETYGSVTLTQKGREISERIYYNHKLITDFLEHSLGLTLAEASENACKMEHVVSDSLLHAIEAYFKKYRKD